MPHRHVSVALRSTAQTVGGTKPSLLTGVNPYKRKFDHKKEGKTALRRVATSNDSDAQTHASTANYLRGPNCSEKRSCSGERRAPGTSSKSKKWLPPRGPEPQNCGAPEHIAYVMKPRNYRYMTICIRDYETTAHLSMQHVF